MHVFILSEFLFLSKIESGLNDGPPEMHLVTRLVENILEALKRSVLLWKYLNGIWFQGIGVSKTQ